MNHITTTVVQQYLSSEFLPHLRNAIQLQQTRNTIAKNIPSVVSKSILNDLLAPTIKNTIASPSKLIETLPEAQETINKGTVIKVPSKKMSLQAGNEASTNNDTEEKISSRPLSRITTQCSSLVKLPEQDEEESDEVRRLRKIKEMMRKFQETKEKNRIINERNKKHSELNKKSTLSNCQYHHTYGYQAEILQVNPLTLHDYQEEKPEPSLLEQLKSNLDAQLQKEAFSSKVKEIQKRKEKQKIDKMPACKIDTIEEEDDYYSKKQNKTGNKQGKEEVERSLRPLFRFHESDIRSLSRNMENDLMEGVKIVTHQQSIVQDVYPKKQLKVIQETVIKQRPRRQKQKTNSSQSLIYSLQNQLRNHSIIDSYSQLRAQSTIPDHQNFQSLQLGKESELNCQFYSRLTRKLDSYDTLQNQTKDLECRLPQIRRPKDRRVSKKRTATEQKLIKGLESIEVKVSTPQSNQQVHFSHRSRHLSALCANKRTESSLDEISGSRQSSKQSEGRSKKELVRDYFKNYKAQFRERMKGIQQVINLYG